MVYLELKRKNLQFQISHQTFGAHSDCRILFLQFFLDIPDFLCNKLFLPFRAINYAFLNRFGEVSPVFRQEFNLI